MTRVGLQRHRKIKKKIEACLSLSFPKKHNPLTIGCKVVEPPAQLGPL
jgi:hypothetical protein